jgi:transposase-like protein/transposase Tn5 family protein
MWFFCEWVSVTGEVRLGSSSGRRMDGTLSAPDRWAQREFSAVLLGDTRRTQRLVRVAASLAQRPSGTLPEALPQWRELKAAYRLFSNPAVSHENILAPHLARTRQSCAAPGEYLLIEDTTLLDYSTHRATRGLGRIGNDRGAGLLLHTTLAARVEEWDEQERPQAQVLGLAGQECWARQGPSRRAQKERWRQRVARPRESQRWGRVLAQMPARPDPASWIYIADRESDIYEVFERCQACAVDFIVRAQFARARAQSDRSVFSAVAQAPVLGEMEVELRGRGESGARLATLELRACTVSLRGVWRPGGERPDLTVQVVQAREIHAPAGSEPIQWVLLTSLSANSLTQARRIVGRYARRWLIEEYHKALKTGARVERSELESAERLRALLAVLAVVAVRLLNTKLLARTRPDEGVDAAAFGPEAVAVLEAEMGRPARGWTQASLLVAIARLGGFLARRGDGAPGWQTIWRGWQRLMTMVDGVRALQTLSLNPEEKRCG